MRVSSRAQFSTVDDADAAAVTDRAIAAQTRADGIAWDDRVAAGLALHRAARVLEES